MINLKKKINKTKIETFFNKFPIILVVQHNPFRSPEWSKFKQKIQQESPDSNWANLQVVQFLNVKNTLLKKFFIHYPSKIENFGRSLSILNQTPTNKGEKISPDYPDWLCQGPNFLIGCGSRSQLGFIWKFLGGHSKSCFITCFFKKQNLTHLDVEKLLKTNSSVYHVFFSSLEKKTDLCRVFNSHLEFSNLWEVPFNLLRTFEILKQFKSQ